MKNSDLLDITRERNELMAFIERLRRAYEEANTWEDVHDIFNTSPEVIFKEQERDLEEKLRIMTKCAQESQDWNWLSAKEHADECGHDFYDINDMQRLHEIAFGKSK